MPQKRHTVDQIVAKLRKADVKGCKALTQYTGCNFDVDCGQGVVQHEASTGLHRLEWPHC